MSEKILIADRIEDIHNDKDEKVGIQVFDSTGDSVKIKGGQGGNLKKRWDELQVGRAYSFAMGEFKGYPFVQDFKSVESKFVKQAQEKVEDKTIAEKRRSMALSYAKDWGIARYQAGDKGATSREIVAVAKYFEHYIATGKEAQIGTTKEHTSKDNGLSPDPTGQPSIEETGLGSGEAREITTAGQMMEWAKSLGIMPTRVREILEIPSPQHIENIPLAVKILTEQFKKEGLIK